MPIDLPDDIQLELVDGSPDMAPSGAVDHTPDIAPPDAVVGGPPPGVIELSFAGELWSWRGPSPYHFISVPPDGARTIHAIASEITYGWGMVPAEVRIGGSRWPTALWPKDGGYVIPITDRYRAAEGLALGDSVAVELTVRR